MKTKKFFMTSLLVMGMIIAKAANGFAPELVLVSQPVLTYDANSVTIYYDLQNIGDYTYKGDVYLFLDPDDGRYYSRKYVRIMSGRIKRVAMTIPAYRLNPAWVYTVMPYYELGDDLYSFTTFEYFVPVSFCWYGYHNEPWVVIHVGPCPRYYHRPGTYRYYYDGYRPMMSPPPPGGPGHEPHDMPPMDPKHHTYDYHHNNGGYPANSSATVAPHGSSTPGSMSSGNTGNTGGNTNNNGGATTRPSGNAGNTNSATTRPSGNSGSSNSSVSRPSGNSSSSVSRPSGNNSNTSSTRPSGSTSRGNSSSTSSRTGNTPSRGR